MGVRENKVERFLDDEIKRLGGVTRKWVSPGHDGVPDRVVIVDGKVWFPEIKTADGKLSPIQKREHKRLKKVGANVITLYGASDVSRFIRMLKDET